MLENKTLSNCFDLKNCYIHYFCLDNLFRISCINQTNLVHTTRRLVDQHMLRRHLSQTNSFHPNLKSIIPSHFFNNHI